MPPSFHQFSCSAQREPPRKATSLPPSIKQPRAAGAPRKATFLSSIEQPRAAEDPPEMPPSFHHSSSPAQREPPSEAPPSFHQSSSPAQREIPQKCHLPFINLAAPRSGSPTRSTSLPPSIEQPRAAGDPPDMPPESFHQFSCSAQREPPEKPPSFHQSSSPAQREILQTSSRSSTFLSSI